MRSPRPPSISRALGRLAPFALLGALPLGCTGADEGPPLRSGLQVAAPPALARVLHRDERLDVPRLLWLDPEAARTLVRGDSPAAVAEQVLDLVADEYRLDSAARSAIYVHHVHDTGRDAILVQLGQRQGGLEVFHGRFTVLLDRSLVPVAASGLLGPRLSRPQPFRLGSAEAVVRAWTELTDLPLDLAAVAAPTRADGGYLLHEVRAESDDLVATAPARVRAMLYPHRESAEPVFYVELEVGQRDGTDSTLHAFVVSAVDGAIRHRADLTADDSPFTYRVWADGAPGFAPWDGPQGPGATPHPTGKLDGYQPKLLPQQRVTLKNAPFSRNDPWLPDNATETAGNNVIAYADIAAPDGLGNGDVRVIPSAPFTFDYLVDPTKSPAKLADATRGVATQLFYTLNYMHDSFYDAGFNEGAANPQNDNLGRGGLGKDRLKAEAQDYSARNNANASTPADGASPRIQMFLFDGYAGSQLLVNRPAGPPLPASAGMFGPARFDITADLVLVDDGTAPTGDACQKPLVNAAAVKGKIALVDRGTCQFTDKVLNAQAAGAVAVVIANNSGGGPPQLGGTPAMPILIGTLGVSQTDGNGLKAKLLQGAVNLTVRRDGSEERDSSLDTTIAIHEWGHVLSNRLVGDGSGLANTQARGMGEGWSDFVALLAIVRPEDALAPANPKFTGVYPNGPFIQSGGPSGGTNQSFYFGLRRVPYSVDKTKNPLTFKHIQNGNALPGGFTYGRAVQNPNAEVHNTGEVWATMLWECYVALLQDSGRLTFAEANRRMKQYLVASLKLTPVTPTFVEARDAVLAAAWATDPVDFKLFWQAFARRGLGLGAVAPARFANDNAGVVESFTVGNDLALVSLALDDKTMTCDGDGVLDSGETGKLTISVRNVGAGALQATKATLSTTTPGLTLGSPTVNLPPSQPYQIVTASVPVSLGKAAALLPIDITVGVTDPGLLVPRTISGKLSLLGNYDELPGASATDDVEGRNTVWTVGGDPALDTTDPPRRTSSGGNQRWLIPDHGSPSDWYLVTPPLEVAPMGSFSFTFKHRYSFEADMGVNFDGGVIEISADNGGSWNDVGRLAIQPSYNGTLDKPVMPPLSANPLAGRPAFANSNPGYPNFIAAAVNLGNAFAGKTVRVRFRVGTDQYSGGPGWELDDLAFTNILNRPFATRGPHRALCQNRPPVADAGPAATVPEKTQFQLAGKGSDPDNDPLTYRWTQIAGPFVGLSDPKVPTPNFRSPATAAPLQLGFALVVSDGKIESLPSTVTITVQPAPRPDGGLLDADLPEPDLAEPGDLATAPDAELPAADLATAIDAALKPDGGTRPEGGAADGDGLSLAPRTGCNCTVGGHPQTSPLAPLVGLGVALLLLRRRRR